MATVTIPATDLRRAARWAAPDPDNPLPILANIRVTVTGGQLVAASYDWETLWLARYAGPGDGGTATVLVPAVPFTEAAASLPPGDVEITVHDGQVDLVTGPGTTKAHRLSVVQDCDPSCYPEFPAMPAILGWATATDLVPAAEFAAGCCSTELELPLTRAVSFRPGGGKLAVEGTNRYIIGLHEVPFNAATATGHAVIPGPLVTQFTPGASGPVFIGADDQAVMLADSWHTVVTKPPAGDYPAVRTVAARWAKAAVATVEIAAGDLRAALGQAAASVATHLNGYTDQLAAEVDADESLSKTARADAKTDKRRHVDTRRGRGMFLTVDGATPCTAELFTEHPFTGEELGRWPLPATCEGGEVLSSLNPAYLLALLPASGIVTLHLPGGVKPARVTVAGSPWEGVICPINETPVSSVT